MEKCISELKSYGISFSPSQWPTALHECVWTVLLLCELMSVSHRGVCCLSVLCRFNGGLPRTSLTLSHGSLCFSHCPFYCGCCFINSPPSAWVCMAVGPCKNICGSQELVFPSLHSGCFSVLLLQCQSCLSLEWCRSELKMCQFL